MPRRHSCRNLRQPEIENLRMSPPRHEDVGRLDVAMHDPLAVRRIEPVGNLYRDAEQVFASIGRPTMVCFSVTPSRNSITMNARSSSSPMS